VNSPPRNPNADFLLAAVGRLTPLLDRIVFVGGCATGLLLTDPAAAPPRPTLDVDVIVEIASYAEFTQLEHELRRLGLRESHAEDAPVCRWVSGNMMVDIMPTEPAILGFSNRWYRPAYAHAAMIELAGHKFRLITAPYFLATKLEAFHGRGKDDYQLSRDLEDIVSVVDGRPELVVELQNSDSALRQYLKTEFSALLDERDFLDALPGHLLPDRASQQRLPIVIDRLQQIVTG
jgi:predicted nucleotidyltransferase